MDPILVALLTLVALTVGALLVVMLQIWFTLRQLQQELRDTHTKLDPLLEEVRNAVGQVRSATHVASAVSLAVTAGIQAWRETRASKAHSEGSGS